MPILFDNIHIPLYDLYHNGIIYVLLIKAEINTLFVRIFIWFYTNIQIPREYSYTYIVNDISAL